MLRALRLIFCIFLTSSFNSAWADFCFDNTNQNGVMAKQICFNDIHVLKWGMPDRKVYLKNADVDEVYAIQKVDPGANGFMVSVKGDYLNYSENCGLTILSQFNFRFLVNAQNEYVHGNNSVLEIQYKYTPNNCQVKVKVGSEKFVPSAPVVN